jgi:hypothetical protein
MDIALWIVQGVLAALMLMVGFMKLAQAPRRTRRQDVLYRGLH